MARSKQKDVANTNGQSDTLKEVTRLVTRIGMIGRDIQSVKQEYDEKIDALKREGTKKVNALEKKRTDAFLKLLKLVLPKWKKLVNKGEQTIELPAGTVQSRGASKPQVVIAKGAEEQAVAALKARDRTEAIRVTETVNKQAIQNDPSLAEGVEGIKLIYSRTLTVKPNEGVVLTRPINKMSAST